MATYHIDIKALSESIAERIAALNRALSSAELHQHVTDYIGHMYPLITVGDLLGVRREVLTALNTYQEAQRFEAHQRAKRQHWQHFQRSNPFANDYGAKYTGTDWSNGQQDYSFKFKVDPETFRRMTEDPQPNYADYVAIPGLKGWSAPSSYNKFHGGNGDFKYCRPFNIKGRHWNVRQFDPIPFKFIPSSLIID